MQVTIIYITELTVSIERPDVIESPAFAFRYIERKEMKNKIDTKEIIEPKTAFIISIC
jgi:hypothetical protein